MIQIVGYQRWNDKIGKWEYSIDNQNWNQTYIKHAFKDRCLNLYDANDVELYESDIVECSQADKDGNIMEKLYAIAYDEQGSMYILVSPEDNIAEPLYMIGSDLLFKVGCMHIDYKMFKEFGIGSTKVKK